MATVLRVRDETIGGASMHRFDLEFPSEEITVRELIRERVYQEVQDYNLRQTGAFRGLIQPTAAEETLNGYELKPGKTIDWKAQFERACSAFEAQSVLLLVGERQATSLDERLRVTSGTDVVFLKLVPLVGG
jgi:hypothetical protein